MGCFNSKSEAYQPEEEAGDAKHPQKLGDTAHAPDPIPQAVVNAIQASNFVQQREAQAQQQQQADPGPQGVILGTPRNSGQNLNVEQLISRANSRAGQYHKNSVGANLHSIMDDQGMLNPMVARQMSVMSHYSVRSESGSVLITPEERMQAEFKLIKLIGRGGFGNVYLGEWEDEKVAVKIIQGYNNAEQDEHEWEARKERMAQMEAVLMSAIAHDNIVQTLKVIASQGGQIDPELAAVEKQLLKGHVPANCKDLEEGLPSFEWHIIMEYCDKGSLSRALSTFMLHQPVDATNVKWDAWASLEILKEVTRSLIFLHQNRILHGDLKAANVLLTSSGLDRRKYIAKVSDFGLSRVLQNNKNHIKTQTFGTVTHVPPELLAKGMLSPKADVYAIGVLMWEIFTGEKVFKQLSDSEVILAVVTKKARPTFPSDVPSRFKFLAERCWSEMMELRPSLEVVMNELESLQKNLCAEGPSSPPITCHVYPSRQKVLAELVQKQKLYIQQQAAAAAAKTSASASASGNNPPISISPSRVRIPGSGSPTPPGSGFASPMVQTPSRVGGFPASSTGALGAYDDKGLGTVSSTGQLGGVPRQESFNGTSQQLNKVGLQLGPRQKSCVEMSDRKRRSSGGRTLSPLAPQYAGSPERLNPEFSVQRPAEPRQSRSGTGVSGEHVSPQGGAQGQGQGQGSALNNGGANSGSINLQGAASLGGHREKTVTFAPEKERTVKFAPDIPQGGS